MTHSQAINGPPDRAFVVRTIVMVCGVLSATLVAIGWSGAIVGPRLGSRMQVPAHGDAASLLLLAASLVAWCLPNRWRWPERTGIAAALAAMAVAIFAGTPLGVLIHVSVGELPGAIAAGYVVVAVLLAGVRVLPTYLFWPLLVAAAAVAEINIAREIVGPPLFSQAIFFAGCPYALLVVGALLLRPQDGVGLVLLRDSPGGAVARWLLPAALVIPLARTDVFVTFVQLPTSSDRLPLTLLTVVEAAAFTAAALGVADMANARHAATRKQLARLARVAQETASAVIVTNLDGVIEWVNEGFTVISGYTLEEVVGMRPGAFLQGPATDPMEVERLGAAIRARQPISAELINYHKNGRPYWIGMKIHPSFNEEGVADGFMAMEADITERKERDLALQRLTSRFDLATGAAEVGVFELEQDTVVIWWNEVMFRIFGQDSAGFVPKCDSWLALVHPDDKDHVCALGQAESATAATFTEEYRIMRPDGTIRRVQSTSSSTKASDGKIRVAGIVLDVTARAEAEEREHALQRQLRESSHQAGMAEIATGILHNVGNVLNSLGIASSTARREMGGLGLERLDQISSLLRAERAGLAEFLTEDERGRKLVDYIPALTQQIAARAQAAQAEVDTIDQLLQHLREIVRAQQTFAKVGGLRERLSLNELVDSALVIKASQIGQIDIVREYEESVEVRTDRHKLLQIVVNLIGNACDAVRESDVRPGRIALRIARDGDDVVLAVEDTGVGMSEKVLAALWRFGFTTKQEGHGFGLHNSANAAREIGATIDAYSAGPGLGSRFSVRIPIENESSLFAGEAA